VSGHHDHDTSMRRRLRAMCYGRVQGRHLSAPMSAVSGGSAVGSVGCVCIGCGRNVTNRDRGTMESREGWRQRPPTPHFCKLATFFVAGPVRIRTCGVDQVCKPAVFFCKLDFFAKWEAISAVLSFRGFWRAPTSVVAIARNFYPPQKSGSPMRPFFERRRSRYWRTSSSCRHRTSMC
jgi:hypothetical protein